MCFKGLSRTHRQGCGFALLDLKRRSGFWWNLLDCSEGILSVLFLFVFGSHAQFCTVWEFLSLLRFGRGIVWETKSQSVSCCCFWRLLD